MSTINDIVVNNYKIQKDEKPVIRIKIRQPITVEPNNSIGVTLSRKTLNTIVVTDKVTRPKKAKKKSK